ncbi:hypothetical protein Ahy_B02g059723 [Arachis hypogaea]|uniref:Auxin-induced protein n=1 Tax=Arachis hypogaea TaxID=3818 RepID=A0A445AH72_ARAHY|nr:hypothetical protein Ahy_B02g059723 [Arachis hypogaea]
MGLRIPSIRRAAKTISKGLEVPKDYLAVYVGDNMRRQVEEYGYDHPMGGLTIPCSEDEFLNIDSRLNEITRAFPCSFHSLHTQEKWGKALFSAKQAISKFIQVPKGYLAVYVGDNQKRYLSEVEEEFGYDYLMGSGYDHPMGGLIIPCSEHVFYQLASPLS